VDKKTILKIVLGMIVTVVLADLIIDALTPLRSQAFTYRLIANICIVIGYAILFLSIKKSGRLDKKASSWRDINFPFPMSFPARILLYAVADLAVINLVVFYWVEKLPLSLVLPVILIEIAAIAAAIAFWVSPYKLKW
jgi:hypothetical protein